MAEKKIKDIPETLSIELKKSITVKTGADEETYSEIVLKEPNLSQLSQFIKRTQKENAVECMRWLISDVSGIPAIVLDKIGVRDYYKAQEYLSLYLTPPEEDDPAGNAEGSQ
jgi:Phage tail assembly chaperone proteins, E, or 41 or 14